MRRTPAVLVVAAMGVALAAACGGNGSSGTSTPSPTGTAPGTGATTAVPGTSTTATATVGTPTPKAPATPTPKPATEGPRVVWMFADPSGAGVMTVRIATDVETTARLEVQVAQGFAPHASTALSKLHVISSPVPSVAYNFQVTVTDASGRTGIALLDFRTPVFRQYWGGASVAPTLSPGGGLTRLLSWTNLKPTPGPSVPGSVYLFSKRPNCTVAEACVGELTARFDDTGGSPTADRVAELHQVAVTFPDQNHDYQVIIAGRLSATQTTMAFYQMDIQGRLLR